MAKKRNLRFTFDAGYGDPDISRLHCDLCDGIFYQAEGGIITMLRGFIVCPTCALCPEFAILSATKAANDRERLARWGEKPADQKGIRKEYLALIKGLRSFKSVDEIPGIITARALAGASETLMRLRDGGGKAA
jgi:hypothetical protein